MTIQLPLRPLHLPSCQNCGARCTVAVHTVQVYTVHWEEQCAVCWGMDSWCVTLLTGRRSSEGPSCPPPIHCTVPALCTLHYALCTLCTLTPYTTFTAHCTTLYTVLHCRSSEEAPCHCPPVTGDYIGRCKSTAECQH